MLDNFVPLLESFIPIWDNYLIYFFALSFLTVVPNLIIKLFGGK